MSAVSTSNDQENLTDESNRSDPSSSSSSSVARDEAGNETITVPEKGEVNQARRLSVKECVLKMLDEMDRRVEKFRSDTMKLENERDDILSSLDTLLNASMLDELDSIDGDEITRYMERLARRSMTVQVNIITERSPPQLEALHLVNTLIDTMIRQVKSDPVATKRLCVAYINSCSEQLLATEIPVTDSVFESAVLGCTIEDQKRIKKRLNGLYSYFHSYGRTTSSIPEEMEENSPAQ